VRTQLALLGLAAALAFICYLPSLTSDLVYDGHAQVVVDTYIHQPAHFADVLTLRVLKTEPWVGTRPMSRPGQMLLLLIEAAIWNQAAWGYHLTSVLLHVGNVLLLGALLARLAREEEARLDRELGLAAALAGLTAVLLFAVHPLTVEPVAEVGYSGDLLMTFCTLGALLLATFFRPARRFAMIARGAGIVLLCFAAVASKEPGLAAGLLVGLYALLFRRGESRMAWAGVTLAALLIATAFLYARFALAWNYPHPPTYPGGSFGAMLTIEPRLWAFMTEKLIWPVGLCADYGPANVAGVTLPAALVILAIVLAAQAALAWKSRLGALGVGVYWLGQATTSNFYPLYHPLADRFEYLPLAGIALQLFAALLVLSRFRVPFFVALGVLAAALVALGTINVQRQAVFADSTALWLDTLRANPESETAADNLGFAFYDTGQFNLAERAFQRAIAIAQGQVPDPWMGLAMTLDAEGRPAAASAAVRKAVALDPTYASPAELHRQLLYDAKDLPRMEAILRRAGIAPAGSSPAKPSS
jgi:tetratricopeptide (TPR) repeat protein